MDGSHWIGFLGGESLHRKRGRRIYIPRGRAAPRMEENTYLKKKKGGTKSSYNLREGGGGIEKGFLEKQVNEVFCGT